MEEATVVQSYLIASIQLHKDRATLILDLNKISNLSFLKWATMFIIKVLVSHLPFRHCCLSQFTNFFLLFAYLVFVL